MNEKDFVDKALDFCPKTGARTPIKAFGETSKVLSKFIPFQVSNLNRPSDELVLGLLEVVRADSSVDKNKLDEEKAKEIITDILQACLFFNVTDMRDIAYIFSSVTHESGFRIPLIEKGDKYYISQYEPVFSVDAKECEKKGGKLYGQLNDGLTIYKKMIGILDDLAKKRAVSANRLDEVIKKVLNLIGTYELMTDGVVLSELEKSKGYDALMFATVCEAFLDVYVLQGVDDAFTTDYLKMPFEQLVNKLVPKKDRQAILKKVKEDDARRIYRASNFLSKLAEKLVHRIEVSNAHKNTDKGDAEKFKGRGLIQLTWKTNYGEFSKLLTTKTSTYYKALTKLGVSDEVKAKLSALAEHPEITEENIPVSAVIVVGGMSQGKFGKKLRDCKVSGSLDFFKARDTVNSRDNTHRAKIAESAEKFLEVLSSKSVR